MTQMGTTGVEAKQLIVDLYGCRASCIDDMDYIREVVHKVCEGVGAGIVEECYHRFLPVGVSAVAVITTSHISIHTWPEYGYAAVDIFSCQEDIPEEVSRLLADSFRAEQVEVRIVKRKLLKEKEDAYGTNAATT